MACTVHERAARPPVGGAGVKMVRLGWGVAILCAGALACSGGGGSGKPPDPDPPSCPPGTVLQGSTCVVTSCPPGQIATPQGCTACPNGTTQDGKSCRPESCDGGAAPCGDVCCGAGQVCSGANQCTAATSCGPGLPACADGQGCVANSCTVADASCIWKPPQGEFSPRVAWSWTGSPSLPDYRHVLSTPVVVPLKRQPSDTFEAPAVVFASATGGEGSPAVLRAVNGRDGRELWTSDPAHPVNAMAGIAAGDLDGDGTTEIVAARRPENNDRMNEGLVAFRNDGTFLWEVRLPPPAGTPASYRPVHWGAPSIANLDGGPTASIVLGASIVDAQGRVVCRGEHGTGTNSVGPISTIADVDADGVPDVVTGNTVYGTDCRPKAGWPNGQADGLVAVADFFQNGHPQIVVVSNNTVRLQDWQGRVVWGPVTMPGSTDAYGGGAPTVADFNGDGKLEIGVAGKSRYTVFTPHAASPILWSRPTQDASAVTGSSVFDFQRDGRAEVVYGDECYTRVYDGITGDTLFEGQNASCTVHENPVIADVDRDGRAEIVVATNTVCSIVCPWGGHAGSGQHGVTVFKDLRDQWVGTRAVWNQHAYHVTNVADDGSIPAKERSHWLDGVTNTFRMNPIGNPNYAAPDVTAELRDVALSAAACPATLKLTIQVWNRGAVLVAPGVPVAIYAGAAGGTPVAVARTAGGIVPGQFEAVTIDVPGPPAAQDFVLVLNDDGTGQGVVGECRREDNAITLKGLRCVGGTQ